jgi:dTDP-4-amino-4,6-dideoxygalactose transaminase
VYLQPFYERKGFKLGYCPHAETYFKQAISIPLFAGMSQMQWQHVVSQLQLQFNLETV